MKEGENIVKDPGDRLKEAIIHDKTAIRLEFLEGLEVLRSGVEFILELFDSVGVDELLWERKRDRSFFLCSASGRLWEFDFSWGGGKLSGVWDFRFEEGSEELVTNADKFEFVS